MEEVKPESQRAAEEFTALTQRAGSLSYQVDCLTAELNETFVKMRNANVAYNKAKKAETPEHSLEATEPKEVTQ